MKPIKPLVLKMRDKLIYKRSLIIMKSENTSRIGFGIRTENETGSETNNVWMNRKQVECILKWLNKNK